MKIKTKLLFGSSLLLMLGACVGPGASAPSDSMDDYHGARSRGESTTDYGYSEDGSSTSPTSNNGSSSNNNMPKSGQLTCGAVDDNLTYSYWKELASSTQQGANEFASYKQKYDFNTFNRLQLNVINGTNIKVKIKDTNYETYVDNFHKAFLFPDTQKEEYTVEISYNDANNEKQTVEKTVKDGDTIDLEQQFTISDYMQIMFVIDSTGSMGDEIKYLQAEIDDVISTVKTNNQNARIELAIMMYRDQNQYEEYLFRYNDFTTDIDAQKQFLLEQSAGGGGDYEEAVDKAFEKAVEQQWSENATKLLFFVADAPAHDEDVPAWNSAVMEAATKGIKIITVASSGIDKKTEYFFRSQSMITGGQYVYLTNHSGIGGNHTNASTQEPVVIEYLNACLIRLINGYFTGVMANPTPYTQR